MTDLSTFLQVNRLFQLVRHLRDGGDLAPDDRAALADAFAAYLAGDALDLETALGLNLAAGESDWRTGAARAWRNELLRMAASRYYPGAPAVQADALAADLKHYAATGWLHERTDDTCPPRLAGKKGELLWRILQARDYALTASAIRRILA